MKLAPLVSAILCSLGLAPAAAQGVSPYRAGADNDSTAVRVTVFPTPSYVERGRAGQQYLNVDFRIENLTDTPLALRRILLSVLSDGEEVVHQQFVATNTAMHDGIKTIPRLDVEPKGTLGVFNPFHTFDPDVPLKRLRYRFLFDAGGSAARSYEATLLVTPIEYAQRVTLFLPLHGRVLVYDGHEFYGHHRRIDASHPALRPMQLADVPVRYANDFTVVDEHGELYRGSPDDPRNWLGYGAPVFAPAAGRVVKAANDIPDNSVKDGKLVVPEGPGVKQDEMGSHVVIDHGNGELSSLVHLRAGSVSVKVGDDVVAGQQVGEIGFSGDTGFHVHLHYNLTTTSEFTTAHALPAYFSNFRRLLGASRTVVERGRVDTGDVVESMR
jgi:hypothetical protein